METTHLIKVCKLFTLSLVLSLGVLFTNFSESAGAAAGNTPVCSPEPSFNYKTIASDQFGVDIQSKSYIVFKLGSGNYRIVYGNSQANLQINFFAGSVYLENFETFTNNAIDYGTNGTAPFKYTYGDAERSMWGNCIYDAHNVNYGSNWYDNGYTDADKYPDYGTPAPEPDTSSSVQKLNEMILHSPDNAHERNVTTSWVTEWKNKVYKKDALGNYEQSDFTRTVYESYIKSLTGGAWAITGESFTNNYNGQNVTTFLIGWNETQRPTVTGNGTGFYLGANQQTYTVAMQLTNSNELQWLYFGNPAGAISFTLSEKLGKPQNGTIYRNYLTTYLMHYPEGETERFNNEGIVADDWLYYRIDDLSGEFAPRNAAGANSCNLFIDENPDANVDTANEAIYEINDCESTVYHKFASHGTYYVRLEVDYNGTLKTYSKTFQVNGDLIEGGFSSSGDRDISEADTQNPILASLRKINAESHGLESLLFAPIAFIGTLLTFQDSCSPVSMELLGSNVSLECVRPQVVASPFGNLYVLASILINGIVMYWVAVKMFETIKNVANPKNDQIEVLKL